MQLETDRLLLKTLDLNLLEAAAKRDLLGIEALGYKTNGEWPEPDFFEALPFFRELLLKNNGTKGFDSWIIVMKDTKEIVGGIGFLGNPDSNGMIEMGFAINKSHRRKGYCIEAAQTLLKWALDQIEVTSIKARCEIENTASENVLEKLGFKIERNDSEFLYWKY
ncbi:GNAT family N-acetyltransferase [Bacillus atrophaeus]|uniref:GNAT family N-acetyltransferase n=1 Tax=Bacillus atrophaeus TaxID=1452 RepID=UPI00227F1D1E|nr:GNAT family N-acetyltransferase [Bacillus atrophaeus]MCY8512686.1 GNAT family N-acetyltransferase [Bacillus atrophaeus]MCY8991101.1 GNAT family N-acetyltransferase [Bacillus atrophaeus]